MFAKRSSVVNSIYSGQQQFFNTRTEPTVKLYPLTLLMFNTNALVYFSWTNNSKEKVLLLSHITFISDNRK
jgi:hypothetical protein